MNLSSLPPYAFGAILIGGLVAFALFRERRRGEALRNWIAAWPGARLHWPVTSETQPPQSLETLALEALGRGPLGWGSAVEIPAAGVSLWILECRTTRPGRKSADWITLVAEFRSGDERSGWVRKRLDLREGTISVAKIENEMAEAGMARGLNRLPSSEEP